MLHPKKTHQITIKGLTTCGKAEFIPVSPLVSIRTTSRAKNLCVKEYRMGKKLWTEEEWCSLCVYNDYDEYKEEPPSKDYCNKCLQEMEKVNDEEA